MSDYNTDNPPWEIYLQSQPWGGVIDVRMGFRDGHGRLHAVKNLTFETIEEGFVIPPAFSLRFDEAQTLMDQLWRVGVRPTEGTGSAGSLKATQEHLKDMQSITKGLLKKQGVTLE